jgi:pimeloyl-ACP methyl ester carboxylesterase
MAMATQARVSATGIHAVLCQSMLDSVPPDLAHLVLYPYATPELLFRYCQLNGAIMATDARKLLTGIVTPTLVVTSTDDATAHPDGSRAVAAAIPDADLLVTEHGDHISLFRGPAELLEAARSFISAQVDRQT